MADEAARAHALKTFEILCKALDSHEWKYDKNEEGLVIDCGARGDDLPMPVKIRVREDRQLVCLVSHIPIEVPENKRIETAAAVSMVNYRLLNGCFEFDIQNGRLFFRMSTGFMGTVLSEEVFSYMLFVSLRIIDDYNDKFEALANGTIGLDAFLPQDQE
ncbi:MAG: YbjN domain-containing protein [Oscillospiraceae bacterium]|nr:YbjN domain-containing protein [Oscillospiraceae bacterium]